METLPQQSARRFALGSMLALFVMSGFAGLIYQSIWSHYLGLTLGHAAYAQTLVLAIFMGGMALGAWFASRMGGRLSNLVAVYAVLELVIGLMGLAFHPVFQAYTAFSQESVLPALHGGGAHAWQWLSAAALILPQCVLLGMTFPILSAGILRVAREESGRVLGGLYFTNSLGAAAGALVATFVLLPRIGMPGAMVVAGIANLLVALGAWWLSRGFDENEAPMEGASREAQNPSERAETRQIGRRLLWVTGLSGAFSFVYEIVWVRLLNQALGTTLHSFELMLAAFIFGLACGGLWVRVYGNRVHDLMRAAGWAQVAMGIAALLSTVAFAHSFQWVSWLMNAVGRSEEGYTWFNLGSAAIAMLVMFPAAFFAGTTLPLFTTALLRRGAGEAAIGRIYAANTLGAIAGVFVAVHLLTPMIGLQLALTVAAVGDALIGLYLLRVLVMKVSPRDIIAVSVLLAAALGAARWQGQADPREQASGVFRAGTFLHPESRVPYLRDGKTSTISVVHIPSVNNAVIATNGKPDASLALDLETAPLPDELTMLMAGALPLVFHPRPADVAIIGWGSGLTAQTLLGSSLVQRIDNIEIEQAMVDGARLFGTRVERAYNDARSHILIDDARTFFAAGGGKFDVIVSEPSNPWVSGVASLFTQEFYALLRRHLRQDGMLVQWLHSYELNDALLATLISALVAEFPEVQVYVSQRIDLLFVASEKPLSSPDLGAIAEPPLRDELARVGLSTQADFVTRYLGSVKTLRAYVRMMGAQGHSDYFPVVALQAPRTRFAGERARFPDVLMLNGIPVLDILEGRGAPSRSQMPEGSPQLHLAGLRDRAIHLVDALRGVASIAPDDKDAALLTLLEWSASPLPHENMERWSDLAARTAMASIGHLPPEDLRGAWIDPAWLAGEQPEAVTRLMRAWSALAQRDSAGMYESARAVLEMRDSGLSQIAQEQMLVIAQLGAIGSGRASQVATLEAGHSAVPSSDQSLAWLRRFLLAWAHEFPTGS